MKKTMKKIVALGSGAVLLVSASVMGTMAYLTSNTEVVNNTFTVGSVEITLDETDVTVYGVKDTDVRVTANSYKLIPGHFYIKDPTVHVTAGSEECWLFVKVENGISAIEGGEKKIADQMTENKWVALEGVDGVYAYQTTVNALEGKVDVPVFNSFIIDGEAETSNYANAAITIDAYAIQADGFTTAAAAWAAAPTTWTT